MGNILELRTVNQLRTMDFFIPSYQRGYRWSKKEIVDLLNDINEFSPKEINDTEEKTWYCLQPIVVKEKSDNTYEVIDGQQRLTTIYLILYYFNQRVIEEDREEIFSIDYETRQSSHEFLQDLKRDSINSDNIDFYYISEAYSTINNWFKNEELDKNSFQSKFKFSTKVIWYESKEDDSISIFTRINIGKIPLTNSELIKALFLNSSNFEKDKFDKVRLKQLEISNEWDRIEQELQNDMFWYFLKGDDKKTNRIELIFDLMNNEVDETDNYSTFRFFSKKFKKKSKDVIETNWLEVKSYFQRFEEWFRERELYHKIGFLLNEGDSIEKFINASKAQTKTDFRNYLNEEIKTKLKGVSLEELQYGDKKVKRVLLLYNIQTMLNNERDNSFFPFDLYKKGNWDIEHITSVKDTPPDKEAHKTQWLIDAQRFIDDKKILNRIKKCDIENDFEDLFEDIVAYFNADIEDQDINDISNLALLDSETNRGYKNAVFPLKRMTIINREKAGTFIPLCTKNVFLKYFSDYPPKISFWSQEDKENYLKDIERVMSPYFTN